MNISAQSQARPLSYRNASPEPPQQQDASSITKRIVDATVDATLAGTDRVAGTLSGAGTASVAYAGKLPFMVKSAAQATADLIKAETIGPNIKVLAGLASPLLVGLGMAGAGLGLVTSVAAGAVSGFQAHKADKPREFTINQAVDKAWSQTRNAIDESANSLLESTGELREKKLAEGEDPWDIPLPPFGRTAQTMAATVAGIAIGGVGGVVTALTTTAREIWNGAKQFVANPGGKEAFGALGTVVGAPVTGLVHGVQKVLTTPVEAAAVAWKEKSLGKALKAAGHEAFDAQTNKLSRAAGSLVGGTAVALPLGATTALTTAASELVEGVKSAVTSPDLNLAERGLSLVSSLVSSPVAGVVHGAATAVATPITSALAGTRTDSLSESLNKGIRGSHGGSRVVGQAVGGAAGGVAVGVPAAVVATGVGIVREVGVGWIDAVKNPDLNLAGKALEAIGGVPGDVITAIGPGLGTAIFTPMLAATEAAQSRSTAVGSNYAAKTSVRSIVGAANPSAMTHEVVVAQ